MIDLKKIDIKTIFIILLSIGLIISFFFGQKSHINTHENEIRVIDSVNTVLKKENDSLKTANMLLDNKISAINTLVDSTNKKISQTQSQIQKLNRNRNEIPTYVNHLSANDVSNSLSKYLNTKSSNNNQ